MKQRIAMVLWVLAAGCNATAKAEPEDAAFAGSDSGDADLVDDAEDDLDDETDEPSAAPAEVDAARVAVDAAIRAAADRGEADRLTLAQQSNELAALQAELDARLAGIEKLEGRIDTLLGAGKVAQERRRERTDLLATLIASMSPQAAATVLAQMSDGEAQDLLFAVAQTDKRRAAKLIATMPPMRAAAIGQRYLSRDPKAIGETTEAEATSAAAPALAPPPAPTPAPASPTPPSVQSEPSEPSEAAP